MKINLIGQQNYEGQQLEGGRKRKRYIDNAIDMIDDVLNEYESILEEKDVVISNLETRNKILETNIMAIRDELVHKIPIVNKCYKGVVHINIDYMNQRKVNNLFKDGRPSSFIISFWLEEKWNLQEKDVIVKMFTYHGTKISPSKNIGCGRRYNSKDTVSQIDDSELWVFVDVRYFPKIEYIFKTKDDVKLLFNNSNNGNINYFVDIVNTKNKIEIIDN